VVFWTCAADLAAAFGGGAAWPVAVVDGMDDGAETAGAGREAEEEEDEEEEDEEDEEDEEPAAAAAAAAAGVLVRRGGISRGSRLSLSMLLLCL